MERVADLMSKGSIYTTSPDETVETAARKMKSSSKGCLVVVAGGRPLGILTERDIVHRVVAAGKSGVKVSEVMTTPLVTIGPKESVADAARLMSKNRIRRLVVTDAENVVGILTVTDFARRAERGGVADYLRAIVGRGSQLETQEALM